MDFATNFTQALNDKFPDFQFTVQRGRKYDRIVHNHSAYAFVNRETGELVKSATWTQPAKNKDGHTFGKYFLNTDEGFESALYNADQYGRFLYNDYRVLVAQ